MASILTAEDVVRRIAPSAPMSTSEAASAFGSSRQPRSCGATESNSGRDGDSAGRGRRKATPPLVCSVELRLLLHLTFATRKPLSGVRQGVSKSWVLQRGGPLFVPALAIAGDQRTGRD